MEKTRTNPFTVAQDRGTVHQNAPKPGSNKIIKSVKNYNRNTKISAAIWTRFWQHSHWLRPFDHWRDQRPHRQTTLPAKPRRARRSRYSLPRNCDFPADRVIDETTPKPIYIFSYYQPWFMVSWLPTAIGAPAPVPEILDSRRLDSHSHFVGNHQTRAMARSARPLSTSFWLIFQNELLSSSLIPGVGIQVNFSWRCMTKESEWYSFLIFMFPVIRGTFKK